jgi:hypothetical protein
LYFSSAILILKVLQGSSEPVAPRIFERIRKGNRAYYANAELLKSKLLKRSTKMRIYLTLIRPGVTYASKTWILTEKVEM